MQNWCSRVRLSGILFDNCLKIRINYEQITNTFISRNGYITIKTKGAGINVYSNITVDCQTKARHLFCEDCFARKDCKVTRSSTNREVKKKMKTRLLLEYKVDLTKIEGSGDFPCPKCGVNMSPEDQTEGNYSIKEIKTGRDILEELASNYLIRWSRMLNH
jgi:hypothetical protein